MLSAEEVSFLPAFANERNKELDAEIRVRCLTCAIMYCQVNSACRDRTVHTLSPF